MHPATSVILFTTLSGSGFGALAWLALAIAWRGVAAGPRPLAIAIAICGAFALSGLIASLAHLGRPERAWRAFSQWRSSWLAREGVAAIATLLAAAALALFAWNGEASRATALAVALLAAATLVCTARIYTSLKPIAAWTDALVLPGYLVLGAWSGLVLLWGLAIALRASFGGAALALGLVASLLAIAVKASYWRRIDAQPAGSVAHAIGIESIGNALPFEAPHTEGNYLLHEMGFRVARKHAARLRAVALAAFAIVAACFALALLLPALGPGACVVAMLSAALALALERWLFFAQAKHVVTLYYGIDARPARAE